VWGELAKSAHKKKKQTKTISGGRFAGSVAAEKRAVTSRTTTGMTNRESQHIKQTTSTHAAIRSPYLACLQKRRITRPKQCGEESDLGIVAVEQRQRHSVRQPGKVPNRRGGCVRDRGERDLSVGFVRKARKRWLPHPQLAKGYLVEQSREAM